MTIIVNNYRPQRSLGKVIFSQASVILGGVCSGGVPGPGGLLRGVPGGDPPPPGTATAAGGTLPTGMHSCSYLHGIENLFRNFTETFFLFATSLEC